MPVQIMATKAADKISNRARMVAFATLDAATEGVISDALKASERARTLTRQTEAFLTRIGA